VTDQVTGWTVTDSVFVETTLAPIIIEDETITQPAGNNGAISVTASGGQGNLTFEWTGPNGFTASTASISNLAGGQYTLTITDMNGCSITEIYNLSTASIEETSVNSISIYPNPASNFVTIKNANNSQSLKVEVYSLDGRLVQLEKLFSINSEYKLTFNNLLSGKYLLKIYTGDKVSQRHISINK
jgi:hypothetical protein